MVVEKGLIESDEMQTSDQERIKKILNAIIADGRIASKGWGEYKKQQYQHENNTKFMSGRIELNRDFTDFLKLLAALLVAAGHYSGYAIANGYGSIIQSSLRQFELIDIQ